MQPKGERKNPNSLKEGTRQQQHCLTVNKNKKLKNVNAKMKRKKKREKRCFSNVKEGELN